nr:hypothetical protein [uncultured Rhodopila sp.]
MPGPLDVPEFAGGATATNIVSAQDDIPVADHVLRFSNGEISRAQAMRSLGIGYSELLDRVAERRLPLPRVDDSQAEAMASMLATLLETAAR